MDSSKGRDCLGDIIRFSRRVCTLTVVAVFAGYGIAWYVWTSGQSLAAIVLATMAFLLGRSLRKIAYSLTVAHFCQKPEHAELVRQLDSGILAQREATIREFINLNASENHQAETVR